MTVLGLVMSGCRGNRNTVDPDLELQVENSTLTVSGKGGPYSIAYTVANPAEGGVIAAEPSDDWVNGFDYGTADRISFNVDANTTSYVRSCQLSVTYTYGDKVISEEIDVVQKAGNGGPFEIIVDEVGTTYLKGSVVPEDQEVTYFVMTSPKEYIDAQDSDQAIFGAIVDHYRSFAESQGKTLSAFLEETGALYEGTQDIYMDILPPDTDQYVIAVGSSLEGEQLTAVSKKQFRTLAEEIVPMSFEISYDMEGPDITMTVVPDNNDRYYYFDVIKTSELEASGLTPAEILQDYVNQDLNMGALVGIGVEEMLAVSCSKGEDSYYYNNLDPETDYTGCACGVSDMGVVNSEVTVKTFVTGEVIPSDNKISMSVRNVNVDRMDVKITTTNSDQYVFIVVKESEVAGMDNSAIIEKMLQNDLSQFAYNGDKESVVSGLTPETSYALLAFGYRSGVATTALEKVVVTTLSESDPAALTFEFNIWDVTSTTVNLNIKGTPESALYYWQICPASWTADDIREYLDGKIQEALEKHWVVDAADYYRQYGSRGFVDYGLYIRLMPDTDYVVYAFGVNEDTGEWATDVNYSEVFHTLSE